MRIAALLLAAGGSRRMGSPKLLLPWGRETVVGAALRAALAAPITDICVVTGHLADQVETACRSVLPAADRPAPVLQFVRNPRWAGGMLTSIQAGLSALSGTYDGFFVALGDMPLVEPSVYARLAAELAEAPESICLPTWEGDRGHPALMPWRLAAESLAAPAADEGLRAIVQRHPESVREVAVDCAGVRIDLDQPAEYALYRPQSDLTGSNACSIVKKSVDDPGGIE